jgi:hypothetical protein
MNHQQIFDIVATHLLKQKARSQNHSRTACLYRGQEGRKCAVGVLIADEHFEPDFNQCGVYNSKVVNSLQKSGISTDIDTMDLLGDLQWIHDSHPVDGWKSRLQSYAAEKKFNTDAITNFQENT